LTPLSTPLLSDERMPAGPDQRASSGAGRSAGAGKSRASELVIEAITHRYQDTPVLRDISFTVRRGEFLTLLGPSGCGKTTLLRILGGFLEPAEGRVLHGGVDVTRLAPHKRPFNMVFQRATLFPHLDVYENIAFGLRIAGAGRGEIDERVRDALALIRLSGLERRRAHELSGGQMQRVALARAIVNHPEVLLLDEPLSALDVKIRLELEVELRRIHRETGATFIFVTHDQREAMSMSDRVAVFNHGHLEQIGTPEDIYRRPSTEFTARFVGESNVIPVEVLEVSGSHAWVAIGGERTQVACTHPVTAGQALMIVRAEAVGVGAEVPQGRRGMPGIVRDCAFRGTGYAYRLEVEGLSETVKAEVPAGGHVGLTLGSQAYAHWTADDVHLLHAEPPTGTEKGHG
jgi:ABC-type Fe3+/spermidine/putrescine transport system ATPase subunit